MPVGLYPNQGSDSGRAVADFSTQLDSGLLPVYVNGNYSSDGILSSVSHPDQRFAHPSGALPVTDSYQIPPQLPGQHQQLSSGQSSRHSNYSRQYPPGPNVPSQKRTQFGHSDFGFSSATCERDEEFKAPIPKRICRLRGIHQGHGVQNQDVEDRTS
ncbi:hypothetical protein PENANT_c263G01012 [Penicillium antarcticum]|uniref:Uncharacterized protein n=1 Tax=Penicillium antarcticum TaxID=416450 RepID=A0A1V6NZ51_9EURO|nr:hypothetical protein PENANT_c282G10162 [Penicillium antarcticum]OQD70003.1 hypothetical protein PENANT_c281G11525 [Penicillium antarcticum]OQD70404.1 hypothetical protein PENANT_c263G01012 [Penicillium antarcticum]